jgi:hypothetical protein
MVESLLTHFDPLTGAVPGAQPTVRHLSNLRGCFGDIKAYERLSRVPWGMDRLCS